MLFLGSVALTAAAAFVLRRRPLALVLLGLTLHAALPSVVVVSRLHLARLSIHPGSLLILWAAVALAWSAPKEVWAAAVRRFEFLVPAVGFFASSLIHALLVTGGPPALGFVLDQAAIVPAILLVLAVTARNDAAREMTRRVILAIAAATAIFAVMQQQANSLILFADAFTQQEWLLRTTDVRWMATFDHPLVLSMFLATATPLLAGVRSSVIALPLLALNIAGVAATQSRLGVALVVAGGAYVVLAGRRGRIATGLTWVGAVAVAALVVTTGVLEGVQERFATADDSTQARTEAAAYFVEILPEYLWMGGGTGMSYTIAYRGGLESSFENSFMMMTLDVGSVTTLLYFGLLLACMVVGRVRGVDRTWIVATAVALMSVLSFSALGVRSAVAPVLWIVAATAAFGPGTRPLRSRTRVSAGSPVPRAAFDPLSQSGADA